jgi:hypothetical protein
MYEMYFSLFYFRDIITLECGWNLYDVFVNYYKILLANTWDIADANFVSIKTVEQSSIYSELFMNETFEWMLWRNSQCSTICDIKNYFECQKFWLGTLFVKKNYINRSFRITLFYPMKMFVSCVHHITTQHYVSHSALVYLLNMIQTVLRTQYAYNVYLFCISYWYGRVICIGTK